MANITSYKVGEIKGILEKIYNDPETRKSVVPLFMSNPGAGKTFIIEEFMRDKGVYKPPFVLSQRMPFEISGMAMVDAELNKMKYYDFDSLLDLKDGDILFIDEVPNANPNTLNAFLTFLESRIMVSGRKLPDIMIVGAGNPQGVAPLTPQIKRRFLQYNVEFDRLSWTNYMKSKYGLIKPIADQLCDLIVREDFKGVNFNTPADLDKALGMIIKDIPTPYGQTLIPLLSKLIENTLDEPIRLSEDEELVKGQHIKWLDLVRHNINNKRKETYETITKF